MVNNTPFIVAAFAVTWIAFIGYAIHLRNARKTAARHYEDAMHDQSGEQR